MKRIFIPTVFLAVIVGTFVCVRLWQTRNEDIKEGNLSTDWIQFATAKAAIRRLSEDIRRFPSTEEGFAPLFERPVSSPSWKGPYLEAQARAYLEDRFVYLAPD